jgi:hypothetical protein
MKQLLEFFSNVQVLLAFAIISLILGLVLLILSANKKSKIIKDAKASNKPIPSLGKYTAGIVIGSVFLILGIMALTYYLSESPKLHKLSIQKNLARNLLTSKDPTEFDMMCNKMFSSSGDPVLYQQYQGMKSTRPVAEVNNLCGNYAKQLLGRK